MAGIVGSAVGQAISNIGTTVGGYMAQSARDEERAEERRRELEERRAYERERDAMYRRTAEQQAAGKGGGGEGGRVGALTDDEKDYEAAAMGMTRPEYDSFMNAQRTGDKTPLYKTKETVGEDGQTQTVTEIPPGFEKEFAAKQTALARIREERAHGKNYDEVVKGRQGMQDIGLVEEAMSDPKKIPTIGASKAAVKGEGMYDGDSNTTRNKFTGKSEATAVGKSVIGENAAQGDKAKADARATDAGTGKVDINGVAANAANLLKLAEIAENQGDTAAANKYREQAAQASAAAIGKKVPPPPPEPSKYKEGQIQVIQAGPNKGKTARWDGKGWVLTNSISSGTVNGR